MFLAQDFLEHMQRAQYSHLCHDLQEHELIGQAWLDQQKKDLIEKQVY